MMNLYEDVKLRTANGLARRLSRRTMMTGAVLAAGMGIREDGLITGNTARFVPHIIG